jgi:hypothetical protein
MLSGMPPEEPTTQELRSIFAERESEEAERAGGAEGEPERRTHARRSEKAAYLKEKLNEQAESQAEDD